MSLPDKNINRFYINELKDKHIIEVQSSMFLSNNRRDNLEPTVCEDCGVPNNERIECFRCIDKI